MKPDELRADLDKVKGWAATLRSVAARPAIQPITEAERDDMVKLADATDRMAEVVRIANRAATNRPPGPAEKLTGISRASQLVLSVNAFHLSLRSPEEFNVEVHPREFVRKEGHTTGPDFKAAECNLTYLPYEFVTQPTREPPPSDTAG